MGETTQVSGGTAGRLDLDERDRAAVDGTGLVTAAWIAGRKVLTARRPECVGVVRVKLKKGRNVVRVKRVRKRKLARGSYRVTITPKTGGRTLTPVRVSFRIRR